MELISVIIPVYNVEKYLIKCIESVIHQTYKNLEIILIDDGSTDSSGHICDEYAKSDSRIIAIHREIGGLSAARNTGIEKANGEYILFVDSDDYIDCGMIEFLVSLAKENNTNMSVCGFNYTDGNDKIWCQENLSFSCSILTCEEYWEYFYSDTRVFYVTMWAKLFRRTLWNEIRFPEGKLHEDEFVIHSIIEQCDNISVSKKPFYFYVQRPKSIVNTRFTIKNLDAAEGMLLRCKYFIQNSHFALAEKTLLMAMYSITSGISKIENISKPDKKRLKELKKLFCSMYKKLLFKNIGIRSKIKCGIFCISIKLFAKAKR